MLIFVNNVWHCWRSIQQETIIIDPPFISGYNFFDLPGFFWYKIQVKSGLLHNPILIFSNGCNLKIPFHSWQGIFIVTIEKSYILPKLLNIKCGVADILRPQWISAIRWLVKLLKDRYSKSLPWLIIIGGWTYGHRQTLYLDLGQK